MTQASSILPAGAKLELLGGALLAVDKGYIHQAVKARIDAWAGLSSLATYYLGNLPQEPSYPAIVGNQIYAEGFHDYQGKGDLSRTQFQFDILGPDFNQLARVAEQLRLCWLATDGTFFGVRIYGARLLGQYQEPYEASAELQRFMIEFELWHDNTSP